MYNFNYKFADVWDIVINKSVRSLDLLLLDTSTGNFIKCFDRVFL